MIRNALRLGKIFGIEIGIDLSWFAIFALVTWTLSSFVFPELYPHWSSTTYWAVGLATSLLFFGSVLAHELGHSLVAIRSGLPVHSITLFIFGGVAQISREPSRPAQEFFIAIAGPIVSIALGLLFGALALPLNPNAPLAALAHWLSQVNFVLALFNLLPGFPMDGGRVLRAILWSISGDLLKATRIASWVGRGLAYLIMLTGVASAFLLGEWLSGLWLVLIGLFLENAASSSYQGLALRETLRGHTARELLRQEPIGVLPELTLDRLVHEYVIQTGRRCFPVVDAYGALLGIITLHHVKGVPQERWPVTRVIDVMTPVDQTVKVRPDEPLDRLMEQMSVDGVNQVLVVENGALLGLVSRDQLLEFIKTRAELGV
jgi:Zn-dependent protease